MPETDTEVSEAVALFRKTGPYGKTALILGTWFGSGLMPFAPGTFGTLAATPLVALSSLFSPLFGALFLMIMSLTAIWSSHVVQHLLTKKDPSEVVIDEVAGFLMTVLWIPLRGERFWPVFCCFAFSISGSRGPQGRLKSTRMGASELCWMIWWQACMRICA
jgi:hypothetical protein